MSKWYKNKKEEFDNIIYGYLVKRLRTPIDQTDAFFTKHIDEIGHELKSDNDWSYTKLDQLLNTLKIAIGQENLQKLTSDYDEIDSFSLMNGPVDSSKYKTKFDRIVALVEECSYLPPEERGKAEYVDDDDEETLSKVERIERALTCANFLMYALKNNDDIPTERQFNEDVLPSVEATFSIRSIGSYSEIMGYLKTNGLITYKMITPEGYVLAARLAKWIVGKELAEHGMDNSDNYRKSWRTLATAC